MSDENVTDFELRLFFLDYIEKIIKQGLNHPDYESGKNNFHLHSESGKLAMTVHKYTNKINELLSDLDKIVIFLRRFSNKKFYQEKGISELDYTKYHFEVYIHKIHTVLELKKLLVNDFYDIKLSPKDCNWKNLIKNKEFKQSGTSKIIDFYYKSFEHLIELRHLNTHRAIFNEPKLEDLKSDLMIYDQFKKLNLEVDKKFQRYRPKFLVDHEIKRYRKDKLEYISEGAEIAKQYAYQFETLILSELFNKAMNKKNAT